MEAKKTGSLQVPGASLYYELRGSGPLLLLIAGGAGDAASYDRIAAFLVAHYTVVTYDRRGYSRSSLGDPQQLLCIETHSDDVHHLLAALTGGPAFVIGCSIGALIGLDLGIRYPAQVRTLVAHEPPIPSLLSDAWRSQAARMQANLSEMARREGTAVAIQKFAESLGVNRADLESRAGLQGVGTGLTASGTDAVAQAESVHIAEYNREAFFKYDTRAVARYTLDLSALKAAPTCILPAGGSASRETWPYQSSLALASCLDTPLVEFPGDHAGFSNHPQEFAGRLHAVLEG
jgi:pimeloyl-ACP methyl ester carboxylesterase